MISIGRYMRGDGRAAGGAPVSSGSPILANLCGGILDYIGVYVFTGEFSRFRPQLQEAKKALSADIAEAEASQVDDSVRAALSGYNLLAQEMLQNNAIEMQEMVGVLGHALTVLCGGSERSVSRLQAIQETLQRTSSIQDVAALRSGLRDVVQLIAEESSKEQTALKREREGIESRVVRFRELMAGNPNRRLQGRDEGIRAISDSLLSATPGKSVWVLAFVVEQLKGIVLRYGPEVVDDLFLQLIHERLKPLAPANTAFRWSPSGIVGVTQAELDLAALQVEMARLNRAPLVCRIPLGSRTAVLKVGLSHLVMEARESLLDRLVGEIDRFTKVVNAGAE